jgi:hypothetical protein
MLVKVMALTKSVPRIYRESGHPTIEKKGELVAFGVAFGDPPLRFVRT